jgi:hypothetical protein
MIGIWATAAWARDIDLKVHDMKGALAGGSEVQVELGEEGGTPQKFTCRDDGKSPDAIAGDRLYTTHVDGLTLDHGTVTVHAEGKTWTGGFRFDEGSDPVLLVGLDAAGFAAASTREVMFVPQEPMLPPGSPGADGANPQPGGPPPGVPGGQTGMPPASEGSGGAAPGGKAATRTGLPPGMWLGWVVGAAAVAGLGAAARAGGRRTERVPAILGESATPLPTTATRGPWAPSDRTDLTLGPGAGLRIADGRWTPAEVALAARRVRAPVRVVVSDATRLEVDGDGYPALTAALAGVADLLWVDDAPK